MQHLQAPSSATCQRILVSANAREEVLSLLCLHAQLPRHVQHGSVQHLYVYASYFCIQSSTWGSKARHEAGHTLTKQLMEVARLGDLLAPMERGLTCHLQDLSIRCASSARVVLRNVAACAKHLATLSASLQRSG